MSADPNACCCGGDDTAGHLVECPAPGLPTEPAPRLPVSSHTRLMAAARMVFAVRPSTWADDADADQVAAWSALEEALRASGGLP